jgi:hypothetical protein
VIVVIDDLPWRFRWDRFNSVSNANPESIALSTLSHLPAEDWLDVPVHQDLWLSSVVRASVAVLYDIMTG